MEYILMFSALIWLILYIIAFKSIHAVKVFDSLSIEILEELPKLSIVIAACNEEDKIQHALTLLLDSDYPSIEFIIVNDRSTDKTGDVINSFAAIDERVKAIHITDLPKGWLGKVNALSKGVEHAQGEWILFSDADVHFKKDALIKAVSYIVKKQRDHLVIIPEVRTSSFFYETSLIAFLIMYFTIVRADKLEKKNTKTFAGAGAFNLVRKQYFEKTEGFEWLKMEVVDDVGLGKMLSLSGAKSSILLSENDISIDWYPSLGEMIKGFEKNSFSATKYSATLAIIAFLIGIMLSLTPTLALIHCALYIKLIGIMLYALIFLSALFQNRQFGIKLFPAIFLQFGQLIMCYTLLRSTIMVLKRGGIVWRGTKYSIKELKKGQRM